MSAHDTGLPAALPEGEKLLWQGKPDWRRLALHGMRVRGVAIYFAIILAWCLVSALTSGTAPAAALLSTLRLAGLALVPIVLMLAYAGLTAWVTTYSVTSRRVVIRLGAAMPMSVNIPFSRIDSADAIIRKDGSGDIALKTSEKKLGYIVLWPHVRPWRMARPEPMLRALPNAAQVAQVLARGLAASASVTPAAVMVPGVPARQPARAPASHAAA